MNEIHISGKIYKTTETERKEGEVYFLVISQELGEIRLYLCL